MSFLYPLFLAGIAAIGLPILLHMIRRHTRRRVVFSSLMFLRPELPRLRTRTRIEHLLLLALRCLVLCLLALAFARPFIPRPAAVNPTASGRRIVLLLDTSASMRRVGIWPRAVTEARSILDGAGPADRVCVMSFDRSARPLIGFEQWEAIRPARRAEAAAQHLSALSPGWGATDLGQALIAASEAIEDDEVYEESQSVGARQIVLISDLQQGSRLDALLAYEWPERTQLLVRTVKGQGQTNASIHLVTSRGLSDPVGKDDSLKVRVTNSSDATRERFQLGWADPGGETTSTINVYVPPGHSTVIPAPPRPNGATAPALVLAGDDDDFDNVLHLAPDSKQMVTLLYLGADEPNDPEQMLYYLREAFGTDGPLPARVTSRPGDETLGSADVEGAHLIVVTDTVSSSNVTLLRRYMESGRTLFLVMKSAAAASTLSALAGLGDLECREAETDGYAMLGRLEFEHPLLASFSDPRFGDFTRIHVWNHRRLDLPGGPKVEIIARYDSGDPAWVQFGIGRGALLVWTCGWHPSDSDLALSSKFVPLLYSAVENGGALFDWRPQYFVGDSVPVPEWTAAGATDRPIRTPDGAVVRPETGQQAFAQTDLPGVYTVTSPASSRRFAINPPPAESRTDPLPIEEIEQLGISLEPPAMAVVAETEQVTRHRSRAAMESEQKLWRWPLLAALLVALMETWLGGWLTRRGSTVEGDEP
jgi:hypothetical protein